MLVKGKILKFEIEGRITPFTLVNKIVHSIFFPTFAPRALSPLFVPAHLPEIIYRYYWSYTLLLNKLDCDYYHCQIEKFKLNILRCRATHPLNPY
jgi:hypothetical protein